MTPEAAKEDRLLALTECMVALDRLTPEGRCRVIDTLRIWYVKGRCRAPVEGRPTLDHDAGDDDSDFGPDDPDLPRW